MYNDFLEWEVYVHGFWAKNLCSGENILCLYLMLFCFTGQLSNWELDLFLILFLQKIEKQGSKKKASWLKILSLSWILHANFLVSLNVQYQHLYSLFNVSLDVSWTPSQYASITKITFPNFMEILVFGDNSLEHLSIEPKWFWFT